MLKLYHGKCPVWMTLDQDQLDQNSQVLPRHRAPGPTFSNSRYHLYELNVIIIKGRNTQKKYF